MESRSSDDDAGPRPFSSLSVMVAGGGSGSSGRGGSERHSALVAAAAAGGSCTTGAAHLKLYLACFLLNLAWKPSGKA